MKIIQVCPRYYPDIGGVETHVKEISERLVHRGFQVEVVCTDPTGKHPKEQAINGVKVKRFRSLAPGDAYFFAPQIYFYLKKQQCEVIHAHSYHALPALFAAFAKRGRKFIFTSHYHGGGHTFFRNLLHKPYKAVGSHIFKTADRVICVSNFEKRLVINHFGLPEANVKFIPNGINLEDFRNADKSKRGKIILYVGRLEKYKGIQFIIKALQSLDGYRLHIVGKGSYESALRKLAIKLGVEDRIVWLHDLPREKLIEQYKAAGVFVFLSSFEAFGIAVAEAIASRLPCIVANTSALKEFVDDRVCFGLYYPININKLADKIIKVSDFDMNFPAFPKNKIKAWDEVVDDIENLYR
jgi:glycosyltransferase involved in cell wall biosynthesis